MHLEIARRGPAEIGRGRSPADDFVRHGVIHRPALDLRQKFGLMRQRLYARRDGIACRVIARRHDQAKEVAKLVFRQNRSIRPRLQDQVQHPRRIPRRGFPLHQIARIDEQFRPRGRVEGHHPEFIRRQLVQHVIGEIRVSIGDQRIALFHQPGQVFIRQADDPPQHPHRQFAGNLLRRVERALGQRLIEDIGAKVADRLFKPRHDRFRKRLRNLDPRHHVFRRIGLLECAPGEVFLIALILHPYAAGRGKKVGLAVQRMDIRMPGDRPEGQALIPFRPVHRIIAAQPGKGVVRGSVQKGVMAGQIGMAVIGGRPDRHQRLLAAAWFFA